MIHAPAEAERNTRNAAAQINSRIKPPLESTDGGFAVLVLIIDIDG